MSPKPYSFTVKGPGSFPLDMLRYAHCWPEGPRDESQVTDALRYVSVTYEVRLVGMRRPTGDRWRSFDARCEVTG